MTAQDFSPAGLSRCTCSFFGRLVGVHSPRCPQSCESGQGKRIIFGNQRFTPSKKKLEKEHETDKQHWFMERQELWRARCNPEELLYQQGQEQMQQWLGECTETRRTASTSARTYNTEWFSLTTPAESRRVSASARTSARSSNPEWFSLTTPGDKSSSSSSSASSSSSSSSSSATSLSSRHLRKSCHDEEERPEVREEEEQPESVVISDVWQLPCSAAVGLSFGTPSKLSLVDVHETVFDHLHPSPKSAHAASDSEELKQPCTHHRLDDSEESGSEARDGSPSNDDSGSLCKVAADHADEKVALPRFSDLLTPLVLPPPTPRDNETQLTRSQFEEPSIAVSSFTQRVGADAPFAVAPSSPRKDLSLVPCSPCTPFTLFTEVSLPVSAQKSRPSAEVYAQRFPNDYEEVQNNVDLFIRNEILNEQQKTIVDLRRDVEAVMSDCACLRIDLKAAVAEVHAAVKAELQQEQSKLREELAMRFRQDQHEQRKIQNELTLQVKHNQQEHQKLQDVLDSMGDQQRKHLEYYSEISKEHGLQQRLGSMQVQLQEEFHLLESSVGVSLEGLSKTLDHVTQQIDNLRQAAISEDTMRMAMEAQMDKMCSEQEKVILDLREDVLTAVKESNTTRKMELAGHSRSIQALCSPTRTGFAPAKDEYPKATRAFWAPYA